MASMRQSTCYVNVATVGVDVWLIDSGTFPYSRQPLPVKMLGKANRLTMIIWQVALVVLNICTTPDSKQSSWGPHGAHLGPVGPRWAPCWPHEPCYRGRRYSGNLLFDVRKWTSSHTFSIIWYCLSMKRCSAYVLTPWIITRAIRLYF